MNIKEFIASLERKNFSLSVQDGKLNLKGDKKKLSKDEIDAIRTNEEIINFIKAHREELVEYLSQSSAPVSAKKKQRHCIYLSSERAAGRNAVPRLIRCRVRCLY